MKFATFAQNRILVSCTAISALLVSSQASADNTPQSLPFAQNWTNAALITANDNWSGVPGIEGFLGQDITIVGATDPQTLLTTSALPNDLDVIANQTNPINQTTGGVAEFDAIANPVVAFQGSGTADAPYVLLHLNTTTWVNILVNCNLRDIDASTDNAVQPVAVQYRVGNSGNFTNLPTAFVADASTGPSLATLVTPVSVTLPAAADNQPLVQVRFITSNAAGADEWIGIDDISVSGSPAHPSILDVTLLEVPNHKANSSVSVRVRLTNNPVSGDPATIRLNSPAIVSPVEIVITNPANQGTALVTFISTPGVDFQIAASPVSNVSPPPVLSSFFDVFTDVPIVINEIDSDPAGPNPSMEFIELYDGGIGNVSLNGLTLLLMDGAVGHAPVAFELDGDFTNANGYYILTHNPAIASLPQGQFTSLNFQAIPGMTNVIEDGPDVVGLFGAEPQALIDDIIPAYHIVDALVYDTDDPDISSYILIYHNPGQPQRNEGGGGNVEGHSLQRACPNGSGGQRNSNKFTASAPTFGLPNTYTNPAQNLAANPTQACPNGQVTLTATVGPDEVIDYYDGVGAGCFTHFIGSAASNAPLLAIAHGGTAGGSTFRAIARNIISGCQAETCVSIFVPHAPVNGQANPCVGDFDVNHFINVDDLLYMINHWGQCPPSPTCCYADVDGNAYTTVDDLLYLINHWGPCP